MYQPGRSGRGLSVRWIGQDGHDYVSASDRHEPDERMDIHLAPVRARPAIARSRFIDITRARRPPMAVQPAPGLLACPPEPAQGGDGRRLWVDPIDMPSGMVCHVLVRYDDDTTAEADVRSRKASLHPAVAFGDGPGPLGRPGPAGPDRRRGLRRPGRAAGRPDSSRRPEPRGSRSSRSGWRPPAGAAGSSARIPRCSTTPSSSRTRRTHSKATSSSSPTATWRDCGSG